VADEAPQPLRVRGHAEALDLRLPEVGAATAAPVVQFAAQQRSALPQPQAQAGYVALRGGGIGVRVVLPETTPPGTYEGTVEIAGQQQPFVAEVHPRAQLILTPALLELAAKPGSSATGRLVAVNAGNLVLDLPARQHIGLFDVAGVDRSLGRTWSAKAEGLERWGILADELAESFGGHTQLLIREGAGPLSPGEERELEIEVPVGADIPAGVSYFGHCRIADSPLAVRVTVLAGEPDANKGA
jgi:hypothetical protein